MEPKNISANGLFCVKTNLKRYIVNFLEGAGGGGACLGLALVDPGRGHGGEAHPVTHHQHNVPATITILFSFLL
jgi:hypothetical protein